MILPINKLRTVSLAMIIGLLLGCNSNRNVKIQLPPRNAVVDTTDGQQYIAIIKYDEDKPDIKLSPEEMHVIDSLLKIAVDEYNRNTKQWMKENKITVKSESELRRYIINLRYYKRQYVAYLNTKGRREVYINCFCINDFEDEWKERVVEVEDGGRCFFRVWIDLDGKSYFNFGTNGWA